MGSWQEVKNALTDLEHAMSDFEDDQDRDLEGLGRDIVEDPREAEIERLRTETLTLRETVRRQADEIKRLKAGAQRRLL